MKCSATTFMAEVDQSFDEQEIDHQDPVDDVDDVDHVDHVPENSELPVPEELQPEQKEIEHDENTVVGGVEKKWPGWPGESVFRMLVPAQKVGSIIGRKGEFIKKIVEETRARIKILDGPPGTAERAVSL